MPALIVPFLVRLTQARTEAEAASTLGEAANLLGYRSGYVIRYADRFSAMSRILDSDASRRGWWTEYFTSSLRPDSENIAELLARSPVIHLDESRFGPGDAKKRELFEAYDLMDVTAVVISYGDEIVGIAGFSGRPEPDGRTETALTVLSYAAFTHLQAQGTPQGNVTITPREREVMGLSAEGLTSSEIAQTLGMSPRTANQHVDNVTAKLGTRNRAHSVAELLRRRLL